LLQKNTLHGSMQRPLLRAAGGKLQTNLHVITTMLADALWYLGARLSAWVMVTSMSKMHCCVTLCLKSQLQEVNNLQLSL
jgi:hypothetical protein